MKILSDIGDPSCIVTNAEVCAFLEEKRLHEDAVLPHNGEKIDRGQAPLLARQVRSYIKASPAGNQSVDSVSRLRSQLDSFGLSNEEFVEIVNLRADNDTVLEAVVRNATAERLTDDQWNEMRDLIHEALEPRPVEDAKEADEVRNEEQPGEMDLEHVE